jgi:L-ascorbate metabolism protein UlaG (beta-lactamase superfamily)
MTVWVESSLNPQGVEALVGDDRICARGSSPDRPARRACRIVTPMLNAIAALAGIVLGTLGAQVDPGRVEVPATGVTEVRYVANSGMLLTISRRRFLIDAPIRAGIPPYATSSREERALLEAARGPYQDVDAILITHWHEDHFSADAVAAHLSSSPRTILVSSPEVIDRVRGVAPGLHASRLRAALPSPGGSEQVDIGGVPVHVLRLRHNPARRLPEQHVGFLIGATAPALHVGDADPAIDNFAGLKSLPPVDLAFLPFWYVADAANRRVVADAIRPGRIVAMHVPPPDADTIAAALRGANVAAVLASHPGTMLAVGR